MQDANKKGNCMGIEGTWKLCTICLMKVKTKLKKDIYNNLWQLKKKKNTKKEERVVYYSVLSLPETCWSWVSDLEFIMSRNFWWFLGVKYEGGRKNDGWESYPLGLLICKSLFHDGVTKSEIVILYCFS